MFGIDVVLYGVMVTLASPPVAAIDPAWAIPLNTALWVVLALMNRKTRQAAESAHDRAVDAMDVAADTRRIVKEAHNATIDAMDDRTQRILARRYTDSPGESGRFESRDPEDQGDQT